MAQVDPAKKVPEAAPETPKATTPKAKAEASPAAPTTPPPTEAPPAAGEIPTKEKLVKEDVASRSAPNSPLKPGTPTTAEGKPHLSPGERGSNLKAEAFAEAHTKRVEIEAQVFIDNEVRKAEAHCERMQSLAEKNRMNEEAKAIKILKKEEARAENVVRDAELKADRVISSAKEKAHLIKANAKEASEKHIADAQTRSDREKAAQDEFKARRLAEIKDQAETMIAAGELIPENPKSKGQSFKRLLSGCTT